MKKSIFLLPALIASLALLSVSCDDDKSEPTVQVASSQETSADHLRMFFEKLHPLDQRIVFSGLPDKLKHALFVNHWQNLANKTTVQAEKDFLNELIRHLKPEHYSDSASGRSEAMGWFRQQAIAGYKVFNNDTVRLRSIMAQIGGDTTAALTTAEEQVPNCTCSTTNDWCAWGWVCRTYVCKIVKKACGDAWLDDCDGICFSRVFASSPSK